ADVEISAHRYATAPIGTEPIEELSYQYVKIDEKNIKGITSAVITFKVTKEWLDANKVGKDEISLYRWTGSAWVEFKASVTSEDTTHVFYKATVSGLSVFAIGRSSTAPDAPVAVPEPVAEPTPAPAPAPVKSSNTGWLIAVIVLALIVGVGYYWYRKNR
ncbi:PGF-pre-PGF domain-containing protein, partial [Candidatus Woesearchaeota archaeon]|nr:PGF-pre-PGF domain-containing protein [Candidatus Woesearchaeota archaeon]